MAAEVKDGQVKDGQDDDGEDADADADDDDEEEASTGVDPEAETHGEPGATGQTGNLYTGDLDDVELDRLFSSDLKALGSVSVGFADSGRIIGSVQVPREPCVELVVPEYAYGTKETVDYLMTAARAVQSQFPDGKPLRVNHFSRKDGGYLRPHKSHQSGRDVDLGFYYRNDENPGRVRGQRIQWMDMARNWLLLRTLVTTTDVQVILVDKKVQDAMYDYALSLGEDKSFLDSVFRAGTASAVQHARRHRDHFHVRFFSPRAQELGRRIQPLLAKRPDENIAQHRVRSGDTLGHIARKYGSSVATIQRANRMRNTFLSLGRVLAVPMRGPCTQCPLPPPFVVPERRIAPPLEAANKQPNPTTVADATLTPAQPQEAGALSATLRQTSGAGAAGVASAAATLATE